ncbi:hypothetical protein [Pluralibacter gergoviae]|uniref:DUF7736 domain-containing protein n=1 Tax=Pluralibacter gergoviae TaxID=61647 RepID=UPI00069FEFE6|nr:hypothetical protein [Pluralibacter gergoviae]
MKTKREIELEVQLYEARDMLLRSNYEILMRDREANDQLLSNARFELDKMIQQENEETKTGGNKPGVTDNKKLTPEQALIISGYTGALACSASAMKSDIAIRLGGQAESSLEPDKISALYKDDYTNLCPYNRPESAIKLTDKQAIIVTGYTGKLLGDVGNFYADLENRLGRKIVNAELPSIGKEKISSLYKDDFMSIC